VGVTVERRVDEARRVARRTKSDMTIDKVVCFGLKEKAGEEETTRASRISANKSPINSIIPVGRKYDKLY